MSQKGKGAFARSGAGVVSKSQTARTGHFAKAIGEEPLVDPQGTQPSVSSNIPAAGSAGVPPAERDEMGRFSREGNAELRPTIVRAQRGMATYGPAVVSSIARTGGQVRVSPGQFGAWARPL